MTVIAHAKIASTTNFTTDGLKRVADTARGTPVVVKTVIGGSDVLTEVGIVDEVTFAMDTVWVRMLVGSKANSICHAVAGVFVHRRFPVDKGRIDGCRTRYVCLTTSTSDYKLGFVEWT